MYQPKAITGQKRREVRIEVCKTNSKMFRKEERKKERKIRKKEKRKGRRREKSERKG